jgi:hypothetical protein
MLGTLCRFKDDEVPAVGGAMVPRIGGISPSGVDTGTGEDVSRSEGRMYEG